MSLPVHPVTLPADLVGADNGRLPDALLVPFTAAGQTTFAYAHRTALRSFEALRGECLRATGRVLTITSVADAYRSFDRQLATFLARYTTTELEGRPTKTYDGRIWWQLPGTAMAASPGTSNHGKAIAFDCAWFINGRVVRIETDPVGWAWFRANAERFGFSWEAQSEPWHLRLVTGDAIPAAVLAYELSLNPPPPPEEEDDMPTAQEIADAVWERQIATRSGKRPAWQVLEWIKTDTSPAGVLGHAVRILKRIAAKFGVSTD
jgi:D-alanyl-D-alanine carboxypeptidase-like protein